MQFKMWVNHEMIPLEDGRIRLNLWVDEYEGYSDNGIFMIKDQTGLLDPEPKYVSTCNPVNLVEYPYGLPEGDRGIFRSNAASLVYRSRQKAGEGLKNIISRVNSTTRSLSHILNPKNQRSFELESDVGVMSVTHSDRLRGPFYCKLSFDTPLFLMKKHPQLGTYCSGFCTARDLETVGVREGSDGGWRVKEVEFLLQYPLLEDLLWIIEAGVRSLSHVL